MVGSKLAVSPPVDRTISCDEQPDSGAVRFLSVVLPDGTGSEHSGPRKGRSLLFAVAAITIVGGFVALGTLSPSISQTVLEPTTTTASSTTTTEVEPPVDPENFTVSQIATGEPLEWEKMVSSARGHPIGVTEHGGTLYLFATGHPPWEPEPGGLTTWTSEDGRNWRPIDDGIGPEFNVTSVTSTPQGLIAVGARPGGGNLILWRSDDAVEWSTRQVPTGADGLYRTPRPLAVGATADSVVVSAVNELDREGLVQNRLREAGIEVDLSQLSWETRYAGDDGIELILYGPLRTPALTVTLDEIGLSELEQELITRDLAVGNWSNIWVVDHDGNWLSGNIPLSHVSAIFGRSDGSFLALGGGGAGLPAAMVSPDGLNWNPTSDSPVPVSASSYPDGFVGFSDRAIPEILASDSGQAWESLYTVDQLPSLGGWFVSAFGAGDDGLAMTVQGRETGGLEPPAGTPTVTSANGSILTLDFEQGLYELTTGDQIEHTWEMPRRGPVDATEGPQVDLESQMVIFPDPETRDTLAEFSFQELRDAESEYRSVSLSDIVQHHALVFSTDGSEWEIQDAGPILGSQAIRLLEVGNGQILAVTVPYSPLPNSSQGGFEIWSAGIP